MSMVRQKDPGIGDPVKTYPISLLERAFGDGDLYSAVQHEVVRVALPPGPLFPSPAEMRGPLSRADIFRPFGRIHSKAPRIVVEESAPPEVLSRNELPSTGWGRYMHDQPSRVSMPSHLWLRPVRHLVKTHASQGADQWYVKREWSSRDRGLDTCQLHEPLPLGCDQPGAGPCGTLLEVSARKGPLYREGFCSRPSTSKKLDVADSRDYLVTGVNSAHVAVGSAVEQVQQLLECNTDLVRRSGTKGKENPRLRPRAVWVQKVSSALGLSEKSLGAYLRGRWIPDLSSESRRWVTSLGNLLEGGAKCIGGGTADTRPLTKEEKEEGVGVVATPLLTLMVADSRVSILPELVLHLTARACFRVRDHTLVPSLKLSAREWCKGRYLTEEVVAHALPYSVGLACCQTRPEQAATRLLEGRDQTVESERSRKWAQSLGAWLGDRASSLVSGLPSGQWWRKNGA